MRRSLTLMVLLTSIWGLVGCGGSNDYGQVSGQQGNVVVNPQPDPPPPPSQTGTVTGRVVSATTGDPLPGVRVTAPAAGVNAQGGASTTTGTDGGFTLVAPTGTYDLRFNATGYIEFLQQVTVRLNQTTDVPDIALSPSLGDNEVYRFVVSWEVENLDLDSQLWLPIGNPYRVFWAQKGDAEEFPFATLDVDSTNSGSETVTIYQLVSGGNYEYGIYNFSGTGSMAGATVRIYGSTGLLHTVTPSNPNGDYWVVATVNGETGQLTIVNQTLADIRDPNAQTSGRVDFSHPTK